jgi:hypothetical protein
LANLMRLSLLKAAHAAMSGATYRKSGSPIFFNPCTRKSANMGHPSRGQGLVWKREICRTTSASRLPPLRSPSRLFIRSSRLALIASWPHRQRRLGAPLPRFPVETCGVDALHAPFLMKGAHADLSSTAWQEIGVKPGFGLSGRPRRLTGFCCH